MFDLEQAITEWRRQMAAGGISTPDVLNELESHLRDDVAEQRRAGADACQAFAAAVGRLGEPSLLQAEFKKTGAAEVRRLQAIAAVGGGFLYLAMASFGLVRQDMSAAERLMGFGALACAALLGLGLRHAARQVQVKARARKAMAAAIAIPGVAWMICFILFILPNLELLPGPLVVALLWALNPTIACGAFGWGLEESRRVKAEVGRT